MICDGTNKFTGKAEIYALSRQSYPKEFIDYLYDKVGFSKDSAIADIGSGTGKFSVELLKRGSEVFCVEPNDDMRAAAEGSLLQYGNFHSIKGRSDNTGLQNNSVNFVTAAQAFHWFDGNKFKQECRRILKENGAVILVWNMRGECQFNARNAEIFEKYCPEFRGFSSEKRDKADVVRFFNGIFERAAFDNSYIVDRKTFIARCKSGSYSLSTYDPNYGQYIRELNELFDKYSTDGVVEIPSETISYIGKI